LKLLVERFPPPDAREHHRFPSVFLLQTAVASLNYLTPGQYLSSLISIHGRIKPFFTARKFLLTFFFFSAIVTSDTRTLLHQHSPTPVIRHLSSSPLTDCRLCPLFLKTHLLTRVLLFLIPIWTFSRTKSVYFDLLYLLKPHYVLSPRFAYVKLLLQVLVPPHHLTPADIQFLFFLFCEVCNGVIVFPFFFLPNSLRLYRLFETLVNSQCADIAFLPFLTFLHSYYPMFFAFLFFPLLLARGNFPSSENQITALLSFPLLLCDVIRLFWRSFRGPLTPRRGAPCTNIHVPRQTFIPLPNSQGPAIDIVRTLVLPFVAPPFTSRHGLS